MLRFKPLGEGLALAVCAAALSSGALAATITPGMYLLDNHPDGNAVPPPYGLRLDELYDVTSGHDIFSFDFAHPSSDMRLDYDSGAQTIDIYGTIYGGRDNGGAYAADAYLGVYTVSFRYDVGVGMVPGDDDVWANPAGGSNFGSILTPLGHSIPLADKSNGTFTFRLGDEDDDLGHRGHPGISGFGWLMAGGAMVSGDQDWLFTATLIPEPASLLLLAFGAPLLRRRVGR